MIGTKIEVPKGAKIKADYRRGGRGLFPLFYDELPSGQYIVDDYDTIDGWDGEETHILLADASWDEDGKVTYHSCKHLYLVRRRDLKVTIDLLEAAQQEAEV